MDRPCQRCGAESRLLAVISASGPLARAEIVLCEPCADAWRERSTEVLIDAMADFVFDRSVIKPREEKKRDESAQRQPT